VKNAWLVPEASQDLSKRDKICNEKNQSIEEVSQEIETSRLDLNLESP
jgi:hypothetical protein